MNLSPFPNASVVLQGALHRIKQAAAETAARGADTLGTAALAASRIRDRDDLLAAQFELSRRKLEFTSAFNAALDRRASRDLGGSERRGDVLTNWDALSLVGDEEVEAQVAANRFALAIQHACEWELRDLDAYVGALLGLGHPDHDRNPLRPELVGTALYNAIESVTTRPEVRKVLYGELGRSFAAAMPQVYAAIIADFRAKGVRPAGLTVRTVEGPGTTAGSSGFATTGSGLDTGGGTAPGALGAMPATPIGQVDAQLMNLIRRLAAVGASLPEAGPLSLGEFASSTGGAGSLPNLIHAHRDELRQVATGTLDHMVIDVVGSLFDQILSDPKVPPQMARQLARLQLPVLRVALGDPTFFSLRRHPVRRFINRIASLACAFDDFEDEAATRFLGLVRELVQDIVGGDFDQMELYESKLGALETYVAEQAAREVEGAGADAVRLFEGKEQDLRVQQQYMQQLRAELAGVEMQEFLREFLTQVWSQAIAQAAGRDDGGAFAARLRRAGRDLVMSVQPKGTPADRKAFLMQLPQLMKDLNEGLESIGWPESAKKAFFGKLLPAHSESLKGQSLRPLDFNLLAKKLDSVFGAPLPSLSTMGAAVARPLPVLDDIVVAGAFSADEAERVGLMRESSVDWDGTVDIELGAEPEVSAVDIDIDGLPPPEAPEPMRGASLADHVQVGFAYQMHVEDGWHKVKLSYVSPGRAFFVFTRGRKHQKTISLTTRMLQRLCDAGRLRAYENAYLIERATARARRQLAALRTTGPGALVTQH